MTALIGIHNLSKSHGTQVLFEGISFTVAQGDRIGLLGPNGAGKSTLLKIILDEEGPDSGNVTKRQGLRIGYAGQFPEFPSAPVEELLIKGLKGDELDLLTRARILLGKAQFSDFTQDASLLSGGWKKRLDIVRALMQEPDILLLDEPTNHLDLEGIIWLEKFLNREKISYVIVSHDRYFLENVANKIVELNRCYPDHVFISEGSMSTYLERKEQHMEGQLQLQRELKSQVRDEVDWLRRSPKARTTKSRSRIQRAYDLIDELTDVQTRNKVTKAGIEFSASDRETRKLLVAKNLGKSLGGKQLFKGVDITLSPGTRLGIMGKNGTGKTTLLKVLAGLIPQDMGTLKYADDLKLVYFDQHRESIPPDATLRRALSPTSDTVTYRGQSIHVNGWAKKFLFSPDRMEMPVKNLSGGERARILIARLMLQPADILFLDEPTNDLDIATLEVIEQSLLEFAGAVVLISHDRCLMDRVCNQILGLGIDREQQLYADYSQWEAAAVAEVPEKKAVSVKSEPTPLSTPKPKKLSYQEQKELDGMEKLITVLEQEVDERQLQLADPAVHADSQKSLALYQLLHESQQKLEKAYDRWQILLDKANSSQ